VAVEKREHTVIGLTEKVIVIGDRHKKIVMARIDTGATKSSIDANLSAVLMLGPILKTKVVKSVHGHTLRAIIKGRVIMKGKEIEGQMTIADRSHMKYKVLIGQNMLKKGFLIDPSLK
jgi:hypothetical protein